MIKYLLLVVCILFADCTNSPRYGNSIGTRKKSNTRNLKTAKRVPKVITGVSSFYGTDFHGKLTANGEVFDMYGLTAAHKTLPLNTTVRVTNLANNKSLILRINDRGPYIKGRILDCSYGAAKKLDFLLQGTTKVRIEIIEVGDNKYMKHKS
mgnify:FL=1